MLKVIKGNILDATEDAIGHGCNCKKTMGSGVALALRNKWPGIYQTDVEYNDFCGKAKIGKFSTLPVRNSKQSRTVQIYNIYTQVKFLPRGIDHFEYEGFRVGLTSVFKDMKSKGLKSIALPMIGAGLAGGNWDMIKKIIEDVSDKEGISVTIYQL